MECIRNIDRSIKHCAAWPKGEMLQCLHVRKSRKKKKAYECSKTESQRERGYPHIAAIMRLLSTLTEPGAFIQGWDVPWRKEHCTLSTKYWIAHAAISLGGTLDWCTLIEGKKRQCAWTWLKNKLFWVAVMDKECWQKRAAALHLLCTAINSINSNIYSFMLQVGAPSKTNYDETLADISILYSTKHSSSETQPDIIKDNLLQSVLINTQ